MAQEFTIKSQEIEDKINQLLPSQGGFQPGVDFSASTMVIPIVDLTETAEGSGLRQDLQRASSINTAHTTAMGGTSTITSTTGYFLLQISYVLNSLTSSNAVSVQITDGTTTSDVFKVRAHGSGTQGPQFGNKELVVRIRAGETLQINSFNNSCRINVSSHQIADINGNLTNT